MDGSLNKRFVAVSFLGGTLTGALALAFIVYPPKCGWAISIDWGDAATWAGAFASFSAVAVALFLAGAADRKAVRASRDTATIIATALCDELRGNRAQLEHASETRDAYGLAPVERAKGMAQSLRSVHATVFRMFTDRVGSLGADVAHAVVTAYASLARCRDIETGANFPEPTFENLYWYERYVEQRGRACDDILDEVRAAITLLWPLTKNQLGFGPPLNGDDEQRFAIVLKGTRERSHVPFKGEPKRR